MGDPGTAAAVADPKKKQTASQEEAAVVESTIDTVKSEQEAGDDEDDDDDDDDDLMDMEFPTVPTIAGPSVKRQKPDSTTTWDNNAICHVLDLSIKSYDDGASVPLWQAPKDESSSSSWDPKPLALPPWAAAEQF